MCVRPFDRVYRDGLGTHVTEVTCGKCFECLQKYQNDIKVRLFHHFEYHPKALFVTLTYNEDNVPYKRMYQKCDPQTGEISFVSRWQPGCFGPAVRAFDGRAVDRDRFGCVKRGRDGYCRSVYKKDVQNWLKRSRSAYFVANGENLDLSYYCTSEYSPVWLRPHYHIILFGIDLNTYRDYFSKQWTEYCGFDYVTAVEYNSDKNHHPASLMNYVSKYCSKGSFENPRVAEGLVEPTFHLSSKGIGKEWILDHLKQFAPDILPEYLALGQKFPYVQRSELKLNSNNLFTVYRYQHVTKSVYRNRYLRDVVQVKRSSFGVEKVGKALSYDFLRALSANYCVGFPPSAHQKQSFTYGLPRYYKAYIQAYAPCTYSQVMSYQHDYRVARDEANIKSIQLYNGCDYGEASLLYSQNIYVDKIAHSSSIGKRLSRFYQSSKIQ